jgi:sugar/nucleoside kinase (ribokinase family)
MTDIYLYGMTVLSTIHKLAGEFPEPDTYGEIAETYLVPGGETMNAAIVLSSLGLSTKIGGPRFGTESEATLRSYASRYGIDVSSVTADPSFPGVRDLVLVGGAHRTVFGRFGRYFSDGSRRWDPPDASACAEARTVSIDPYLGEESDSAARYCVAASRPYVTIDCPFGGYLHSNAAATVVSREYRRQTYPGTADARLFELYAGTAAGLVVFTAGSEPILFGRARGVAREARPFEVEVASTLGAGDVFRAGIVYGIHRGYDDGRAVRFASALAAVSCTRMPIADFPPSLAETEALANR